MEPPNHTTTFCQVVLKNATETSWMSWPSFRDKPKPAWILPTTCSLLLLKATQRPLLVSWLIFVLLMYLVYDLFTFQTNLDGNPKPMDQWSTISNMPWGLSTFRLAFSTNLFNGVTRAEVIAWFICMRIKRSINKCTTITFLILGLFHKFIQIDITCLKYHQQIIFLIINGTYYSF